MNRIKKATEEFEFRSDLERIFPAAGDNTLREMRKEITRTWKGKLLWDGFTFYHNRPIPKYIQAFLMGFYAAAITFNADEH